MSSTTDEQRAAEQAAEPWTPTEAVATPQVAAPGEPAAAPVAAPSEAAAAPSAATATPPPAKRKRGRLIALVAVGGVVLLGAGFGVGFAVGNATATPTMGQFDPSQMGGGGPGGGFGGQGGPGSQSDQGTGTESGTGT